MIVPLIFEQALAVLVGLVNTIMIAGVGRVAISGVSLVDTLNILIINVFAAFATGGAVVAGYFLAKRSRKCQQSSVAAYFIFLSHFHCCFGGICSIT